MSAVTHQLTLQEFRSKYGEDVKPYFEYWDGIAIQKAVPTKLHAILQRLLGDVFEELRLHSFTELTLRVHPDWEPIPDIAATVDDIPGPYPTTPVEIVAEVLSPTDSFDMVETKCERYAEIGVAEILVFDPAARKTWRWDRRLQSLLRVVPNSLPLMNGRFTLDLEDLWKRFDAKANRAV